MLKKKSVLKMIPVLAFMLCSVGSACSEAAHWEYVGQDAVTDEKYFIDMESAWHDEFGGGSFTKCENPKREYIMVNTLNFTNRSDGDYDASITKIKVYDAKGNLVDTISDGAAGVAKADSILGKLCLAIINLGK